MGCVISVIIFVLVMNLADEYLKVKIPKAVQYYKGDFPVPLMKLFMDDACLLTALTYDMSNVILSSSRSLLIGPDSSLRHQNLGL